MILSELNSRTIGQSEFVCNETVHNTSRSTVSDGTASRRRAVPSRTVLRCNTGRPPRILPGHDIYALKPELFWYFLVFLFSTGRNTKVTVSRATSRRYFFFPLGEIPDLTECDHVRKSLQFYESLRASLGGQSFFLLHVHTIRLTYKIEVARGTGLSLAETCCRGFVWLQNS